MIFGDRMISNNISGKRVILDNISGKRMIFGEGGLGLMDPTEFEKSVGSPKRSQKLHSLPKLFKECIGSPS